MNDKTKEPNIGSSEYIENIIKNSRQVAITVSDGVVQNTKESTNVDRLLAEMKFSAEVIEAKEPARMPNKAELKDEGNFIKFKTAEDVDRFHQQVSASLNELASDYTKKRKAGADIIKDAVSVFNEGLDSFAVALKDPGSRTMDKSTMDFLAHASLSIAYRDNGFDKNLLHAPEDFINKHAAEKYKKDIPALSKKVNYDFAKTIKTALDKHINPGSRER